MATCGRGSGWHGGGTGAGVDRDVRVGQCRTGHGAHPGLQHDFYRRPLNRGVQRQSVAALRRLLYVGRLVGNSESSPAGPYLSQPPL